MLHFTYMENEILAKLVEQDAKIEEIWKSVEKSRKYFLITAWITVGAIVIPMVGLAFVVPSFLSSYNTTLGDITGK